MEHDDYFPRQPHDDQDMPEVQLDSDTDMAASAAASSSTVRSNRFSSSSAHPRKQSRMSRSSQPRPILTPGSPHSSTAVAIHHNLLPSAPASPPTPAPSPTPTQRVPDWSTAAEHEDSQIKNTRSLFCDMNRDERQRLLGELLNLCDSHELSFVAGFVGPRLKKDPFMVLPTELCLRVSLARNYS
jgi:F-box and WD-40 domain protein CDC4